MGREFSKEKNFTGGENVKYILECGGYVRIWSSFGKFVNHYIENFKNLDFVCVWDGSVFN